MNTKLSVTAAIAFLSGLTTSQVYEVVSTGETIEVTPDVPALAAEVLGATADETKAALTGAETSKVLCKRGVVDNRPGRVYCTDGGTAGFLLDEQIDDDLNAGDEFELSTDGTKVYVVAAVAP